MRVAATLVLLFPLAAVPAVAAGGGWRAPVAGAVTRGFEPGPAYAGGHHRGADFAARAGATVRAACGGRVVVARRVGSSGGVVTVRCGRWRVSHLPLAAIAVREGAPIASGARIGTAAGGAAHTGIHLGVRREGRRFGYVDPLRFIRPQPTAPPPLGRPPRARAPIRPPPLAVARPTGSSPLGAGARPLAPWPAWVGLALLLAGLAGAGTRERRRRAARAPAVGPNRAPGHPAHAG